MSSRFSKLFKKVGDVIDKADSFQETLKTAHKVADDKINELQEKARERLARREQQLLDMKNAALAIGTIELEEVDVETFKKIVDESTHANLNTNETLEVAIFHRGPLATAMRINETFYAVKYKV